LHSPPFWLDGAAFAEKGDAVSWPGSSGYRWGQRALRAMRNWTAIGPA